MRYTIAAAAIALFLAWDLIENEGRFIEQGARMITHAVRSMGLS